MTLIKSDEKPIEARIFIDLDKKTIDFEHIIGKKGRFWCAYNVIRPTLDSLGFLLIILCLPLIFIVFIINFMEYIKTYDTIHLLYNVITLIFLFFLMYGGILFSFILTFIPGFNSKIMPKLGAITHILGGTATKIYVYKIKNNIFEIPIFQNAFLKYKLFGDFNDCLKRIEIVEHPFHYMQDKKVWRCRHWRALFYFNRIPKNGFMKLMFI